MREMTTKEVQRMSLDILHDFHNYCVLNNIHYSLSGGTLIGAIRHNGFIPWDDDIDVQMPRPDYEKFIHNYSSEKGFKIFCAQLPESANKNMVYPYARLCDVENTVVDTGRVPWINDQVGIWIDILPCDGAPSDYEEARIHIKRNHDLVCRLYWYGIKLSKWSIILKKASIKSKMKIIVKKLIPSFLFKDIYQKYIMNKKQYDYEKSNYFFTTVHYGMKEWQPKRFMEGFVLHKFEDGEFYVMTGYDDNLRTLYGDYMKLPSEKDQVSHDFNKYYWKD